MTLTFILLSGTLNKNEGVKMFFTKTIKEWQENRKIKTDRELLKKKEEALSETLGVAFIGVIAGIVGTIFFSFLFYILVQIIGEVTNDGVSIIMLPPVAYSVPILLLLLVGIMKMLIMTVNSGWIFLKFLFVKSEDYDLENKPSLRL